MKKTLLFSNIVGDIFKEDNNLRFNDYMEKYLKKNINSSYNLVFINAPGLGSEENYLNSILTCFKNIGIIFNKILDIDLETDKTIVNNFLNDNNKIIYFLMGGNPITQMEIINKCNLKDKIKEYDGLVIGFCAGAINLSKYSIITTDEDFEETDSYNGINRVNLIIEPHYNNKNDDKRNNEIKEFVKMYKSKIYAVPDESIIAVEDNKIFEYGKIYHFE